MENGPVNQPADTRLWVGGWGGAGRGGAERAGAVEEEEEEAVARQMAAGHWPQVHPHLSVQPQ